MLKHYKELSGEHVFGRLVDYIVSSGPVVAMIWEGENVVETVRDMIGPTRPSDCEYATIRGEFGIDKIRNVIHGSYSAEIANKEIASGTKKSTIIGTSSIVDPSG